MSILNFIFMWVIRIIITVLLIAWGLYEFVLWCGRQCKAWADRRLDECL